MARGRGIVARMTLAALLLAAPVIYWWMGLACLELTGGSRERAPLAPLLGFVVTGWLPQVALALGGVPYGVALTLGVLAIVPLRRAGALWALRAEWGRDFGIFLLCYAAGVTLLTLSPMPAFGLWGTDWAMYLRAGPALLEYASNPGAFAAGLPELMAERPRLFAARPHAFSAAISPIAGFAEPLVVLEVAAAVAAASLVPALGYCARQLGGPPLSLGWVMFFLSLPLFGQHLLTLWPKLAAAACVLVGLAEAVGYRRHGHLADLVWACCWLGFAIAQHHSSALYLPLLGLLVAYRRSGEGASGPMIDWSAAGRALAIGTIALIATAGLYEGWALVRLGFDARVASNPAVHQATSTDAGFLAWKTLKQLVSTVVGTGYAELWRNLSQAMASEGRAGALGHGSHALSVWLILLTGTFVGNLLPIVLTARSHLVEAWQEVRTSELFVPLMLGGAIAAVAAAALAPVVYLSAAQLGATPICLALVCAASLGLERTALRRATIVSLALGLVPWLAQLVVARTAYAAALAGDRARLAWFGRYESDSELMRVLEATSLAQAMTLPGVLVLAAGIAVCVGWLRRDAPGAGP